MLIWLAFFLLFPLLLIWLSRRFPLLGKAGPVVLCYAAGIIMGTFGLIPAAAKTVQTNLVDLSIIIALPLLFFSINVRAWFRLAGVSLLSFALMGAAVLIAATVGFFLFHGPLGAETWKAAGMLVGCYTGGTLNLAAIGTGLGVETDLYNALNLADMLVTPLYLLLAITILRRLLLKILPPFKSAAKPDVEAYSQAPARDMPVSEGEHSFQIRGAVGVTVMAITIAGLGGGLSFLAPRSHQALVAILAVSTLGILCSFIPAVRRVKSSFAIGNYFLMLFILAVSSQANLGRLLELAPVAMGMVGLVVALAALIHVLLASLFRLDVDTVITTSVAGIFSPPFVPMIAAALKNREMILTGIITGMIGWTAGTYLGIGFAYLLRAMF